MKLSDSVYACETCSRVYNHAVLRNCPGCAGAAVNDASRRAHSPSPMQQANERNAEITNLLKESIRASNRTTYAVRAMVSFTVITVITLLIAGLFFGFMALAGGGPLSAVFGFLAGLVLICGTIYALVTLIREWVLSEVSKR